MKGKTSIILIILAVILADQALKFYVKLNFPIGGGFDILGLNWAKIHFIENDGMAFGLSFGGVIGKYALSIFRIVLVFFLIAFLKNIIKEKQSFGLQFSFALIIAGAFGNIIDGMFYGLIFSESCYHCGVAELMPADGGYAGFLQGWVVDMFYFPLFSVVLPDWFPFIGGDNFSFFKPVFNIADSAISIGVVLILLFHRSYFMSSKTKKEDSNTPSENLTDQSTPIHHST